MTKELSIGAIVDGKVTAIKEYGAFVSLVPGRSGLVHISQIASEYVKNVEDYLSVGDTIQVKIIDISDSGKISLSIKEVAPLERKDGEKLLKKPHRNNDDTGASARNQRTRQQEKKPSDRMNSLEEKLKRWMKTSEERINELQAKQKRK